jgi:hypothetical protein
MSVSPSLKAVEHPWRDVVVDGKYAHAFWAEAFVWVHLLTQKE